MIFPQVEITPEDLAIRKKTVGGSNWKELASKSSRQIFGSGRLLAKSLHFDHDLDEPMALVHQSSFVLNKSRLEETNYSVLNHVGIQTEVEVNVEESLGLSVVPPLMTKLQYLGSDPLYFTACDDHVQGVSRKWYKSIKKLVKHLMEVIDEVPQYEDRRDLVTVRAIFVWISQNMRYAKRILVVRCN